jgi:threonine aldolase
MAEDHQNARQLAEGLAALPGLHIDLDTVQTNIIVIELIDTPYSVPDAVSALKAQGVLVIPFGKTKMRAVTHLDISQMDISEAIQVFRAVFGAPISA